MTLLAPGAGSSAGDPLEGPTAAVDVEHGTSLWKGRLPAAAARPVRHRGA
jgi:hypothetical protein